MKISARQYAVSLYEATKDKTSSQVKAAIEKFVEIMAANNDLNLAERTIAEYEKFYNSQEGIVEAQIISARKLDSSIVKILDEYISKVAKAKEVKSEQIIDKNILGGVVIKYDDKILDGSMKTRVEELKKEIEK